MNNKVKAGVAAVAGVSILASGATFALWSKSAPVTGGTITNGNLDITAVNAGNYDTSTDRTDAVAIPGANGLTGHSINLATWRGVPGDKVAFVYNIDGALQGDNMTASLSVTTPNNAPLGNGNGWTFQYRLYDTAGNQVGDTVNNFNALRFASADNSHNVPELPTMPTTLAATGGEYKLIVEGTFDPDTIETNEALDTVTLTNLNVSLSQDRSPAPGGFTGAAGPQ